MVSKWLFVLLLQGLITVYTAQEQCHTTNNDAAIKCNKMEITGTPGESADGVYTSGAMECDGKCEAHYKLMSENNQTQYFIRLSSGQWGIAESPCSTDAEDLTRSFPWADTVRTDQQPTITCVDYEEHLTLGEGSISGEFIMPGFTESTELIHLYHVELPDTTSNIRFSIDNVCGGDMQEVLIEIRGDNGTIAHEHCDVCDTNRCQSLTQTFSETSQHREFELKINITGRGSNQKLDVKYTLDHQEDIDIPEPDVGNQEGDTPETTEASVTDEYISEGPEDEDTTGAPDESLIDTTVKEVMTGTGQPHVTGVPDEVTTGNVEDVTEQVVTERNVDTTGGEDVVTTQAAPEEVPVVIPGDEDDSEYNETTTATPEQTSGPTDANTTESGVHVPGPAMTTVVDVQDTAIPEVATVPELDTTGSQDDISNQTESTTEGGENIGVLPLGPANTVPAETTEEEISTTTSKDTLTTTNAIHDSMTPDGTTLQDDKDRGGMPVDPAIVADTTTEEEKSATTTEAIQVELSTTAADQDIGVPDATTVAPIDETTTQAAATTKADDGMVDLPDQGSHETTKIPEEPTKGTEKETAATTTKSAPEPSTPSTIKPGDSVPDGETTVGETETTTSKDIPVVIPGRCTPNTCPYHGVCMASGECRCQISSECPRADPDGGVCMDGTTYPTRCHAEVRMCQVQEHHEVEEHPCDVPTVVPRDPANVFVPEGGAAGDYFILYIVIGVLAALVIILIIVIFVIRRRRQKRYNVGQHIIVKPQVKQPLPQTQTKAAPPKSQPQQDQHQPQQQSKPQQQQQLQSQPPVRVPSEKKRLSRPSSTSSENYRASPKSKPHLITVEEKPEIHRDGDDDSLNGCIVPMTEANESTDPANNNVFKLKDPPTKAETGNETAVGNGDVAVVLSVSSSGSDSGVEALSEAKEEPPKSQSTMSSNSTNYEMKQDAVIEMDSPSDDVFVEDDVTLV